MEALCVDEAGRVVEDDVVFKRVEVRKFGA